MVATINSLLEDKAFDPGLAQAMGVAYDAACMMSAEKCRKRAEACMKIAAASNARERASLIEIADHWLKLAEEVMHIADHPTTEDLATGSNRQ